MPQADYAEDLTRKAPCECVTCQQIGTLADSINQLAMAVDHLIAYIPGIDTNIDFQIEMQKRLRKLREQVRELIPK